MHSRGHLTFNSPFPADSQRTPPDFHRFLLCFLRKYSSAAKGSLKVPVFPGCQRVPDATPARGHLSISGLTAYTTPCCDTHMRFSSGRVSALSVQPIATAFNADSQEVAQGSNLEPSVLASCPHCTSAETDALPIELATTSKPSAPEDAPLRLT